MPIIRQEIFMPKIKVKKFDKYEFVYKTKINVRDINYGGHLSNDSVVGLMHEARIDMLNQMGFSELNLGDGQTGVIMSDLAVSFKSEGFMLDKIEIFSHIDEINDATFRIFYKIMRGDTLLVLAETGMVAYNYQKKQIGEVTREFLKKLQVFCGESVTESLDRR
jgi:acyl-CoA thioesterase FadM